MLGRYLGIGLVVAELLVTGGCSTGGHGVADRKSVRLWLEKRTTLPEATEEVFFYIDEQLRQFQSKGVRPEVLEDTRTRRAVLAGKWVANFDIHRMVDDESRRSSGVEF